VGPADRTGARRAPEPPAQDAARLCSARASGPGSETAHPHPPGAGDAPVTNQQWHVLVGPGKTCLDNPEIVEQLGAAIARVNGELAPAERISSWIILADPWLPDTDLLTPTAKLKRRGVHARYAAEIEKMYSETPLGWSE
jgi:hypothetical protein